MPNKHYQHKTDSTTITKDTAKDSVTTESLAAFILQNMSTPVEYD